MKRTKKQLLLAMLMSMVCIHVNAHDISVSNGGKTIYYNYVNKYDANNSFIGTELEVTYRGSSYDAYNEYSGDVVIPASVNYIGTTYPVTSIGQNAFSKCSNLTSINIPNSVTEIWSFAFEGCTGLTSVTIPNSVTYLQGCTFSGCTGLESVTIPILGIDGDFSGCTSLTNVNLGNVTNIPRLTFLGCSSLENITIPNTVKSIDDYAFHGCTNLTNIEIPSSVESIGDGAFTDCPNLTDIDIPSSVKSIGESAFGGTPWQTNFLSNQPNGVVYIGNVAFSFKGSMANNTSITLKEGTLGIAGGAFYHKTQLVSISFPSSLTNIGSKAFYSCTGLTNISIPSSVTFIGSSVFAGCTNLTSVSVEWDTPIAITGQLKDFDYQNAILYVPQGCSGAYEAANYWKDFKEIQEVITQQSYTLNSLGKGTYCSEYDLDFTNVSGIKAYIISGFNPENGKLILTRAYEIPAGTGLYIDGTPSTTYNIPVKATAFYYSNMLKGVLASSTIPTYENGYTNYVLVPYGTDDVIFAHANDATLSANRAYVQIPSSIAGARSRLGIEIDDNTTGIEGVLTPDTEESEGDYYNLNGQKVQNLKRGIYIRNGKKIIIR